MDENFKNIKWRLTKTRIREVIQVVDVPTTPSKRFNCTIHIWHCGPFSTYSYRAGNILCCSWTILKFQDDSNQSLLISQNIWIICYIVFRVYAYLYSTYCCLDSSSNSFFFLIMNSYTFCFYFWNFEAHKPMSYYQMLRFCIAFKG